MIILSVVFHTIIKNPYAAYLIFSATTTKVKRKKNGYIFGVPITLPKRLWIRHWVGHNSLSKLKKHTVKSVVLKQIF